jgi:hypothetical protein
MTYYFQSGSTHINLLNLRKGGLRILSWFTTNVFNIEFSERTHPYVVNHFNGVLDRFVEKGGE